MTNEEKIIAAIQKSGLHFNYLIMCDDNGRPIGIKNRDVYSSIFGKHTNDYNQNLDLDPVSKMTISDITIEILKKWGMSKKLTASQAAATLGRMTSEKKKKSSAENGRKSKNGGRPVGSKSRQVHVVLYDGPDQHSATGVTPDTPVTYQKAAWIIKKSPYGGYTFPCTDQNGKHCECH